MVVALACPASAQEEEREGQLHGSVTAVTDGTPLTGAAVRVMGTGLRTHTDQRGRFRLVRVPAGTVEVTVTSLGRRSWTGTATVEAGGVSVLRVELDTEPIGVDPVVVLMKRTRMLGDPAGPGAVPGAAQVLTRQDLEAQSSPFDNVHDVLRQMPGVNVLEEDGYGLRPNIGLRGTGVERSAKITLMEDGVLAAPAPYAAPAAYYFPVTGRMEAVEVRKGSSQVKYGPRTIGGALNLVSSRIPDQTSWALDLAGGQDATFRGRGRWGGATDRFGWLLETYQIRTEGFKNLVGGDDTGFRVGDYLAKLRVNTDRDARIYQELEVKLGLTDHVSRETYLGLTDPDFGDDPVLRYPASQPDVMDADHRLLQGRWFIRPSRAFDATVTAYRSDFKRNWYKLQSVLGTGISSVMDRPAEHEDALAILRGADSDTDALKVRANNRRYFAQGVQATGGWSPGAHRIEASLRLHQDEEDRFQLEDGYQMRDAVMVLTTSGAPGSQSNRVSRARAVSLYLQDDLQWGKWIVSPGLRYETIRFRRTDYATNDPQRLQPARIRENGVSALIPGLAASYRVRPAFHVFAGVHRGFGPPGPGADPATEPEASVNFELGTRLRNAGVGTTLTLFFSDYSNILGTATLATGESGAGDQFNGGAADVAGLELGVDYDFLHGSPSTIRLPARLAYTYTVAEFRSAFESAYDPWGTVEVGDQLPYLPAHQFSGSLGIEALGWSSTLSAFGASAMRTRAGQGALLPHESTDSYVVLNLTADYGLPGNGTVYLSVQNLLDERYVVARRPAGARPGMPRTVMAGFRILR
jgi:Fe(3+) dicitrate transport protein